MINKLYCDLVGQATATGEEVTTRKGVKIHSLYNVPMRLENPLNCIVEGRCDKKYLSGEFDLYASGSNKVEDAAKLSKFWNKCTDDGITFNSNYGKLLFHDVNSAGFTQLQHVVNCLVNNKYSKKAVAIIYDAENGFVSNDNPCTMYLHFRIDKADRLHCTAHSRSVDLFFGFPYDVPFFCGIQYSVMELLRPVYPDISLGHYSHMFNNLHVYERNVDALGKVPYCVQQATSAANIVIALDLFKQLYEKLKLRIVPPSTDAVKMAEAWAASKMSNCLKKKVGAAAYIGDTLVAVGWGGRQDITCNKCDRDAGRKFHGDGCASVHAEMRVISHLMKNNIDCKDVVLYTTHGPCDACLKLCDFAGVREIVYDVPYKCDYTYWPRLVVRTVAK